MNLSNIDYGDLDNHARVRIEKARSGILSKRDLESRPEETSSIAEEIVEAYYILEDVYMKMHDLATKLANESHPAARSAYEDMIKALEYKAEMYKTDIEKLRFMHENNL